MKVINSFKVLEKKNSQGGFTLIELILAAVLTSMIASGAFILFQQSSFLREHSNEVGRLQFRTRSLSKTLQTMIESSGGVGLPVLYDFKSAEKQRGIISDYSIAGSNDSFSFRSIKGSPALIHTGLSGDLIHNGREDIPVRGIKNLKTDISVYIIDPLSSINPQASATVSDLGNDPSLDYSTVSLGALEPPAGQSQIRNSYLKANEFPSGYFLIEDFYETEILIKENNLIYSRTPVYGTGTDEEYILLRNVYGLEIDFDYIFKNGDDYETGILSEATSVSKDELLDPQQWPKIKTVIIKVLARSEKPDSTFSEKRKFNFNGVKFDPSSAEYMINGRSYKGDKFKWSMFTMKVDLRNQI